jgi:hypothetical protein
MPLSGEGADPLAAIQGRLNDFAAAVIRAARGDPEQARTALSALRELNWAAGLDFEGVPPRAAWGIARVSRRDGGLPRPGRWRSPALGKSRAAIQASSLRHSVPPDIAALVRQLEADAPALVYLVIHTALGAAKIGVTDAAGSRIAQHRRAGWQLLAAFQVSAEMACDIEDDVLRCWRHELGLPSYLRRDQMPQGGWTETVAAGRVDLAATVAHVCELALLPEARPAA